MIVRLYVSSGEYTKTLRVDVLNTADEVLRRVWARHQVFLSAAGLSDLDPSSVVIKVRGLCDYLSGLSGPIYESHYIQQCLRDSKLPELVLEHRSKVYGPAVAEQAHDLGSALAEPMLGPMPDAASGARLPAGAVSSLELGETRMLVRVLAQDPDAPAVSIRLFRGVVPLSPSVSSSEELSVCVASLPRESVLELAVRSGRLRIPLFTRAGMLDVEEDFVVHVHDGQGKWWGIEVTVGLDPEPEGPVAFPAIFEAVVFGESSTGGLGRVSEAPGDLAWKKIESILKGGPGARYSEADLSMLWRYAPFLTVRPNALAHVWKAIEWTNVEMVARAYGYLAQWAPIGWLSALQLLSGAFVDLKIRDFAVNSIRSVSDHLLQRLVLPLVYAVLDEDRGDSALAQFLVSRGRESMRLTIALFWALRAEAAARPECAERARVLVEGLLRVKGGAVSSLVKGVTAQAGLVARLEAGVQSLMDGTTERIQDLGALFGARGIHHPLHPRWVLGAFRGSESEVLRCVPEKGRTTLKLAYENNDPTGEPFYFLYKTGLDLRPEQAIQTVMAMMDRVWQQGGLTLRLDPYQTLVVSGSAGLVELRTKGEMAPLDQVGPISAWLELRAGTEAAFVSAAAAYVVACHILDLDGECMVEGETGAMFVFSFTHGTSEQVLREIRGALEGNVEGVEALIVLALDALETISRERALQTVVVDLFGAVGLESRLDVVFGGGVAISRARLEARLRTALLRPPSAAR